MNRMNGMMGEYVLCEDGFEVIRMEDEGEVALNDREAEQLDQIIEKLDKIIEEQDQERG